MMLDLLGDSGFRTAGGNFSEGLKQFIISFNIRSELELERAPLKVPINCTLMATLICMLEQVLAAKCLRIQGRVQLASIMNPNYNMYNVQVQ